MSFRFRSDLETLLKTFTGPSPVKKLFWELLGYDRRDEVISLAGLRSELRACVLDARLLASHHEFLIFSLNLTAAGSTPRILRGLNRFLRLKHRYMAVLIGDEGQNAWRLMYQPEALRSNKTSARVVSISVGHTDENPHRQASVLARLRTYDDDDEPIGLLELITSFDEVYLPLALQRPDTRRVLDTFEFLVRQLTTFPLLTMTEERALILQFDDTYDTLVLDENGREKNYRVLDFDRADEHYRIRDKLVLHNLRLCFYHAKRYARNQEDILDLFDAGVIGMLRAIDRFDSAKGAKLSTYATHWILNYVRKTARELRTTINVPPHLLQLPTNARARIIFHSLSCDDRAGDCGPVEELPDTSEMNPLSGLECSERSNVVQELLARLREREAYILRRRFGIGGFDRATLSEIAISMSLTKERVRQLETKAIERLKGLLRSRGFEEG